MTYRLDRNISQMRTALGNSGSRFNDSALTYANSFGIKTGPSRATAAQLKRLEDMRKKRQDNIYKGLTTDAIPQDQAMRNVMDNVSQAIDVLIEGVPAAAQARINKTDGKFYYEKDGKYYSDFGKLRRATRGTPIYFSPAWGLVINYNKTANASARLVNIVKKQWTNQDLMDRAARSSWRTVLKNAARGTDYLAKGKEAADKLYTRYEQKAAQAKSIRDILGAGNAEPDAIAMQEEIAMGPSETRGNGGGLAWVARGPRGGA